MGIGCLQLCAMTRRFLGEVRRFWGVNLRIGDGIASMIFPSLICYTTIVSFPESVESLRYFVEICNDFRLR